MDQRERFEKYTQRLLDSVAADPDVLGLVLLGSTADTSRVDQWSDHDFFLLVTPGAEDRFRSDLRWLPDSQNIAFSVRDSKHGLKVLYRDGAILEFAVATISDAATFGGSPQRVVLDRQNVAEALGEGRTEPAKLDDASRFRIFLNLILIGVGRARRGEELAGGELVRSAAFEHLVWLLRQHLPVASASVDISADPFNPWRRFESSFPRLGQALGEAMAQRCEPCGLRLLDLAEEHLSAHWPEFPESEIRLVRELLDHSEA